MDWQMICKYARKRSRLTRALESANKRVISFASQAFLVASAAATRFANFHKRSPDIWCAAQRDFPIRSCGAWFLEQTPLFCQRAGKLQSSTVSKRFFEDDNAVGIAEFFAHLLP